MRRTYLFAILLFLSACVADRGPRDAPWEWSDWGMTPEAVIAASDGRAYPSRPLNCEHALACLLRGGEAARAEWVDDGIGFYVFFQFGDARTGLRAMTVFPQRGVTCEAVGNWLDANWGNAVRSADGIQTAEYRERTARIVFYIGPSSIQACAIHVLPLTA